jgi:hypothetical protein
MVAISFCLPAAAVAVNLCSAFAWREPSPAAAAADPPSTEVPQLLLANDGL